MDPEKPLTVGKPYPNDPPFQSEKNCSGRLSLVKAMPEESSSVKVVTNDACSPKALNVSSVPFCTDTHHIGLEYEKLRLGTLMVKPPIAG